MSDFGVIEQSSGLKNVLERLDQEVAGAPGAKKDVTEADGKVITTFTVEKPGTYDETPERFVLEKSVPKKGSEPTTTTLTHTWRMYNPGVDVENHREIVQFVTKKGLFGLGSSVTATKSEKSFTGTKTIYADSNTPRSSVDFAQKPTELVDSILSKIK